MTLFTKKKAAGALAAAAALGLVLSTPGMASAEPTGAPTFRPLVAVGSDTVQDVANGLSDSALDASGAKVFGSYNATNPTTGVTYDDIQTRSGGVLFDRPNGSTDGLRAVRAADNGALWRGTVITGQVDIARVSSGFETTTTSDLAYVPIGQDAVSWAKHENNFTAPANIPLGATANEVWTTGTNTGRLKLTLKNIYDTETTFDDGEDFDSTTSQLFAAASGTESYTVGAASSTAQIVPFQPQAASGTRQFFAQTITGSTSGVFGSHVADNYSGTSVQEHDGTILAIPALQDRAIVPFSIAQWVAQSNGVSPSRLEGAVLGQVDGVSATTGSGTSYVQNAAFPTALKRLVYFVAKTSRLTSTGNAATSADAQLQRFVRGQANLGAASNTVVPANAAAEWIGRDNNVIAQYGFAALPTSGTGNVIGKIAGYRSYTSFS
jgi:hypothetical protein